jgi:hypothetical protein
MTSDKTTVKPQPQLEGFTNICPDGHACDNESTCVESLMHEHGYVCDCHFAYLQTGRVYAGMSCQHAATDYCTATGEISESSFCANSGKCRATVGPKDVHPGCDCPTGYAGEHCQYIAGSQPDALSYFVDGTTASDIDVFRNTEGPGINPAAVVLPILAVTLIVLGFFLWKLPSLNLNGHTVDKSKSADENMMDADGSASMKNKSNLLVNTSSGHRRNSTPSFSSSHKAALMDPPDFDDLLEQSDHVKFHMDPTMAVTHKLFASDPTLHYNHTSDTSGTGSPSSYVEDYDMAALPAFEEYDPNDFTTTNTDPRLT